MVSGVDSSYKVMQIKYCYKDQQTLNKGNYGLPSVLQYQNKKLNNEMKQNIINISAEKYKYLCSTQVQSAVESLRINFPKIDQLVSPYLMLHLTYKKIQQTLTSFSLKH